MANTSTFETVYVSSADKLVARAELIDKLENELDATRGLNSVEIMMPSTNAGACKVKRDKKADENKKTPGGSPLAKDIREITQTILAETDCDALQMKIKTAINSQLDDLKDKMGLTKEKLDEIMPLLSIPTNPFKLPAYIKKVTVGRVLPDLDATIDLIVKTVEVVSAIAELAQVIQKVIPNLKACALDLKGDLTGQIKDEIEGVVNTVKSEIAKTIAEAICQGVNAAGISANNIEDAFDAINAIDDLVNTLDDVKAIAESALQSNIDQIAASQTTMQELTGVPPVLDTTSVDGFLASAQSPEYQQYKETVKSVLNIPDPVANTLPVVSGNAVVGSTLSCSNGEWSANGNLLTYSHQWFRNGAEINGANTFSYVPTIEDVEMKLYCTVTAQTNVSVEQAKSAEVGPVTFQLAPADRPTISGIAANGSTLTASTGNWPFTPTLILYEWIRGTSTVVQTLSGSNTYKVANTDIGSTLKCRVVAQSLRYTLSDVTDPTSTVTI